MTNPLQNDTSIHVIIFCMKFTVKKNDCGNKRQADKIHSFIAKVPWWFLNYVWCLLKFGQGIITLMTNILVLSMGQFF